MHAATRTRLMWLSIFAVAMAQLAAPRDAWRQFAAFLWAFGLGDIFYYVWLYLMLGWPDSLLTRDVLFLIPGPWIGPCLAPMIIALVMTISGGVLDSLRDRELEVRVRRLDARSLSLATVPDRPRRAHGCGLHGLAAKCTGGELGGFDRRKEAWMNDRTPPLSRIVFAVAGLKLLAHLATSAHYPLHQDELY